jgi:hypothetical protein
MIEVFIRSHSQYVDVGTYREMSVHTVCAPGWVDTMISKLKGRILSQEDFAVLQQASQVKSKLVSILVVHDVSSLKGKIIAAKRGVRRTPAVIVDGRKFEAEEALKALSKVCADLTLARQTQKGL